MKDKHKNLLIKILKILGVLIALIAIFYIAVFLTFRYGIKCTCYGIETNSRCFGIKTMCFGLAPSLNIDSNREEYLEYNTLHERIKTKDFLYVIVVLNVEFIPEGNLSRKEVELQRELIKEKQMELIQGLPKGSSVYQQYQITPAIAFKVDSNGLDYLTESPLVKTMQEDVPNRAF